MSNFFGTKKYVLEFQKNQRLPRTILFSSHLEDRFQELNEFDLNFNDCTGLQMKEIKSVLTQYRKYSTITSIKVRS